MSISFRRGLNIFIELFRNQVNENSILNSITYPNIERFKNIFDTPNKRLYLSGLVFTLLFYRSYLLFKKIFLLPFKLGLFSFLFSVLGIDVSWFLNFFNFFKFNVPHWVYFQYINLYTNWLNWFYKVGEIKSIKTPEIIETNSVIPVQENKNNLKWYVLGFILLGGVVFAVYYLDWLPSFGDGSGANTAPPAPNPVKGKGRIISRFDILDALGSGEFNENNLEFPHQIKITDNTTKIVESVQPSIPEPVKSPQTGNHDPVQEINNAWQFKGPTNVDASTSKATSNPWDGNAPSSPTGSDSSDKTIKYWFKKK